MRKIFKNAENNMSKIWVYKMELNSISHYSVWTSITKIAISFQNVRKRLLRLYTFYALIDKFFKIGSTWWKHQFRMITQSKSHCNWYLCPTNMIKLLATWCGRLQNVLVFTVATMFGMYRREVHKSMRQSEMKKATEDKSRRRGFWIWWGKPDLKLSLSRYRKRCTIVSEQSLWYVYY